MLYSLRYYFRILVHHTKYLEICAIMIVISFAFTTTSISILSTEIMAENFSNADMFPFFINIGSTDPSYSTFMLLLPLFIALPVGQILIVEKNNKSMILTRCNKLGHYISKCLVSFFSGFSLAFICLVCSIIFSQIILSSDIQNVHYISTVFTPNDVEGTKSSIVLYNLFLTDPFKVSVLNMIMISVYSGCLSLMSVLVEIFIHNKVLLYCIPFIFVILNIIMGGLFPSLVDLLYIDCRFSNSFIYLLLYLIFYIILIVFSSLWYHRKDCY